MATKLLDQVREAARLKHLSIRTEEAYLQWIKRYILFHHNRHPAEMGENEIRSFLVHLARDKYVSSSTQNQASMLGRAFSSQRMFFKIGIGNGHLRHVKNVAECSSPRSAHIRE